MSEPLKNGQHLEVVLAKGSVKVTVDERTSSTQKSGPQDGRTIDQRGAPLPNIPILMTTVR